MSDKYVRAFFSPLKLGNKPKFLFEEFTQHKLPRFIEICQVS